jgi:hypothetical protein
VFGGACSICSVPCFVSNWNCGIAYPRASYISAVGPRSGLFYLKLLYGPMTSEERSSETASNGEDVAMAVSKHKHYCYVYQEL